MATETSGSENSHGLAEPAPATPARGLKIGPERSIALCRHVRFVDGADGGTLLDIGADRFYNLNATGALILRGLLDRESSENLVECLVSKTRADPEQVRNDLSSFVTELLARRFISLDERSR